MTNRRFTPTLLQLILALAVVLRLAHALSLNPLDVYSTGGDSAWYLLNGYALVTGQDNTHVTIPDAPHPGVPVRLAYLPTPPLYLLFAGFWQAVLPPAAAIIMIRLFQVLMSAALCFFAHRLAAILGGQRAGLIAAAALAVSPAFIVEPAAVLSETLFMFLVGAALWLYTRIFAPGEANAARSLIAAAALFGLATLTRAALLLFPAGLAIHLLLAGGLRRGFRQAALLLAIYTLVVSTWTLYNLARWGRLVIGGEGFAAFLFISATDWQGPEALDAQLAETAGGDVPDDTGERQEIFQHAAAQIIAQDVPGYISRRLADLTAALLQPHGTIYYGGESLKDLAVDWWLTDRSPVGLLRLAQGEWFWHKLVIYIFHYAGLLLGLAGLWVSRRNWRVAMPSFGFILYILLVHLVLDALPRYLFPAMVVWWAFAGVALSRLRRPGTAARW
ncbi:MAG: glycosyltransferase family 39 protein [Chloroflexi bacterium]|nr:glycosyltransferase family 39 protein [Chloroflexota bacterium]